MRSHPLEERKRFLVATAKAARAFRRHGAILPAMLAEAAVERRLDEIATRFGRDARFEAEDALEVET